MDDIFRFFRPNSRTHSRSNAYLCALLSYYIYPKADLLKNTIPGSGSTNSRFRALFQALSSRDPFAIDFISGGDAEAAVLVNSRVAIVVFRGTELSLGEWVTGQSSNARFQLRQMPDEWGNVAVHDGFYRALAQVYQGVRKRVREVDDNRPVFLTGHSRGAAMAALCAYRLHMVGGVQPACVYGFGSPRVGDARWRDKYAEEGLWERTFRWVHRYDFGHQVPDFGSLSNVPPTRYYHVGQLNHYLTLQNINLDHANPDFEPGIKASSGSDHSMPTYCSLLFNQLPGRRRRGGGLIKDDVGRALPVLPG